MRTVNLRENFTEDKYTNLYEVQAAVNKIYNLALENNLGKDIIFEWQQHVIVVQSLVDNLAHKSAFGGFYLEKLPKRGTSGSTGGSYTNV